ncbi:alpha/beta hydrolase [Dactylosporangium sp. NPDC051485]|uniref:serine aminopeptidase domain-containing protein n=1 Tax=Dactylosporangium sp. NPDC051485 TaxID=3154846 RepID=UPI00342658A3
MFVSVAVPEEDNGGAVIVCPSLMTDALAGYRAEVLLARSLAAKGHAAIRMHYRGTGHSDGDGAVTFDSMVDDAIRAADEVARHGRPVAFVGSRLGALVAAAAAGRRGARALAMWEPATEAELYFRESVRGRLMRETVQRNRTKVTARGLFAELAGGATIDVLGYPLTPQLYESFAGRTLAALLDATRCPALAVHFGRSQAHQEALANLAASHGLEVDAVPAAIDWWLLDNGRLPPEALIEHTSGWLAEQVGR